jgi:hypothetical protein
MFGPIYVPMKFKIELHTKIYNSILYLYIGTI